MLACDHLTGAGRDTGATAFAQRRVDPANTFVFKEVDGIERAQIVADTAARAPLLVNTGADGLDLDLALADQCEHARRRSRYLAYARRDVFGPLACSGDKDAVRHRGNRVELWMPLDEE